MAHADKIQATLDHFTDASRTALGSWLGLFQGTGLGSWLEQFEASYRSGLDSTERFVEQSLSYQAEWMRTYRQALAGAPEAMRPLAQAAESVLGLAERGLEARVDFWQRYFKEARSIDFTRAGDDGDMFAAWNRMSRQAIENQSEWLKALVPQANSNALVEPAAAEEPAEEAKPVAKRANGKASTAARKTA